MRVLICENDPNIAMDLCCQLYEQGHCICGGARDTTECLENVARALPDLVVIDEDARGGLTGLSLVETLAMSGFPAAVLSDEPEALAHRTSAKAVLEKPFSAAALASLIAEFSSGEDHRTAAA